MMRSGLVVVRRKGYVSDRKYNVNKLASSIGLSNGEITSNYKGIEGEAWPQENDLAGLRPESGLISVDKIEFVHSYMDKLTHNEPSQLLFIIVGGGRAEDNLVPSGFEFCGYDVGVYESEYNSFSSIFSDLIYGKFGLLTGFHPKLNDNMLFPDIGTALDFTNERDALLKEGLDLETVEEGEWLGPIPVWCWSRGPGNNVLVNKTLSLEE